MLPLVRLIALLNIVTGLSRGRNEPKHKLNNTYDSGNPANRKKPGRSLEPAKEESWHPEEKKHRSHERRYWFASLLLSLIVAIGAALSVRYAYQAATESHEQAVQARRQADTANDAFLENDRPWIRVTGLTNITVAVDKPFSIISALVNVENVGHSPAQKVRVSAKAITDSTIDDANIAIRQTCQRTAESDGVGSESLIFGSESKPLAAIDMITYERVDQKHREDILRSFSVQNPFVSKDEWDRARDQRLSQPLRTAITLVGCVAYSISTKSAVGQTAFAFELYQNCGLGLGCSFDWTQRRDYTRTEVEVRQSTINAFAR